MYWNVLVKEVLLVFLHNTTIQVRKQIFMYLQFGYFYSFPVQHLLWVVIICLKEAISEKVFFWIKYGYKYVYYMVYIYIMVHDKYKYICARYKFHDLAIAIVQDVVIQVD